MKFRLSISLVLACLLTQAVFSQNRSSRPNILFILVDDLKPNLGVYGDTIAQSPNIDKLAGEGMVFEQAYCNQAVCGPSRYNIMLSSRSTSTGLYTFGTEFRDIIPDAVTLPQYFKNAGYHTESMGKVYHSGHGNTNDEASWSIPHFKEKVIEYVDPESTGRQLTREEAFFENTRMYIEDTPANHELPRGAAWEAPDVLDDAYADGRVANHAINRLRKLKNKPDQPFFMAVGFARPHLPFSVPKKYWDLYDPEHLPMPEYEKAPQGSPGFTAKRDHEMANYFPVPVGQDVYDDDLKRKLIHGYYASISYMDTQLGRVMDELKRLGLDKNTIVVLWGDHGWHLGDHAIWTKHTNFEQANRIPLIFKVPGVTKPGSSTKQFAESVDVYPTLATLAGLDKPTGPQPIDGIDLSPVLKNGSREIKDHAYHTFPMGGYLGEAIRTDRYRMIRWTPVRNNGKEVLYELYDYDNDPGETKNIASEKPDVVAELTEILEKYPEAKKRI
ncbi:iduronate-2-sulfatase [Sinomicrobium pectinilyticum]|uniref:Iduronate-2-sulfatase n=1 Tax=Sinomicrobium pectinilyticum TaxID=1084421 RepID=A0A3N0EVA8_SINP1|nr:sulfatase [Sinomicrobium pectinilyticum]RNL91761.1 iduronate-2-sulfatase [Sinomicrobium pectinilyticum]